MKEKWESRKLGDICEFVRGPFGGSLKKSMFKPEGIAVYEQQHAINNQFKNIRYFIDDEKFTEMSRFELLPGDLIMSCSGTMGKVAIVPKEIQKGIINQALLKLTPSGKLNVEFLRFWMESPLFQEQLSKYSKGVAIKNVASVKVLKEISVSLPSVDIQKRIVSILDEAFAGIDTAIANTEKNLSNARELFESYLNSVFSQRGKGWSENKRVSDKRSTQSTNQEKMVCTASLELNNGKATKTGGRDATMRHIPGELSLSVGMPSTGARNGWKWSPLSDLARLESGHTPSRKRPEYWGGEIPWIGIKDARKNHGQRITDTIQKTNDLGIANSSARILPENTVCLSRTASVGYVLVMGRPMATSQDFVNWVCSNRLAPDFLKYLFLAEGREGLLRYASGSVHQTIYFPEAKAFHICHPDMDEQARIVDQCDSIREETLRLEANYQQKIEALAELKQSLLQKALSGELTAEADKLIDEAVA